MSTGLLSLSRLAAPTEPIHGTRITAAREALAYWSGRESDLPWRQREPEYQKAFIQGTHLIAAVVDGPTPELATAATQALVGRPPGLEVEAQDLELRRRR